jgi:hypothetical protein
MCSSSEPVVLPVPMLLLLCCVLASVLIVAAAVASVALQLTVLAVASLLATARVARRPRTGDVLQRVTVLLEPLLVAALAGGDTVRPRAR